MSEEFIIEGIPRDVEADLIEALAVYGIHASTIVPADREPGIIRISRTGSGDSNTPDLQGSRDIPQIQVETWGKDSVEAFDLAQKVYAGFKALEWQGHTVPEAAMHTLRMDAPRSYDDDLAPDLYRVIFSAQFITDFTEVTLTKE